jgi:hypothetical protein
MSLFDDASLIVTPNGVKASKLYAIKPTDGSGDLSVVRATSATRVDANGLVEIPRTNLILQSQTFENASWTKTRCSITSNSIISPDGTLTADTLVEDSTASSTHPTSQSVTVTASAQTFSIYAKSANRNWLQLQFLSTSNATAFFDLSNGVVGTVGSAATASIQSVGNGWYRCIITATTTAGSNTIGIYPASANGINSYTGNGTASLYIWGAMVQESNVATEYIPTVASIRTKFAGITQNGSSASNIPRLDYTNSSCPSILVEPQITNLVLRSEEFDNTSWSKNDATIGANATISPSGILTADKLIEGTLLGNHFTNRNITNSNSLFSFSVFAKKSERNFLYLQAFATVPNNFTYLPFAYFNLDNGTVGNVSGATATIQDYGNGWYRCILNCTSIFSQLSASVGIYIMSATANGVNSYLGNGTSGIFIWGAQAEAGSNATSYIPTVASTVTRNADVISKTGISSLIGQTEGTIYWDVKDLTGSATGTGNPDFGIRNTAFTNWIGITTNSFALPLRVTVRRTAGIMIDYTANITRAKVCVKYGAFGAKLFVNGVQIATSALNPSFSFDRLDIKGDIISYRTNNFVLFPTALTDDECINLTTL